MGKIMVCAGFSPRTTTRRPRVAARGDGNGDTGAGDEGEGPPGSALPRAPRPEEARRIMDHQVLMTGAGLRTPRAAAAAGIVFSLLLGLAWPRNRALPLSAAS